MSSGAITGLCSRSCKKAALDGKVPTDANHGVRWGILRVLPAVPPAPSASPELSGRQGDTEHAGLLCAPASITSPSPSHYPGKAERQVSPQEPQKFSSDADTCPLRQPASPVSFLPPPPHHPVQAEWP
ncbi:hypothetical protein O3P69_000684 [Scylla paramamosain]|uniref:Uncharacterized protein n=1 Tax=Scylla paramamosain TaxID=85552 RepID=A0AAW0UQM0_SCYPA